MDLIDYRELFYAHVLELCTLLGIDAPPRQEGDTIAYRLDLDELTFALVHSMSRQPAMLLSRCAFGAAGDGEDRVASMVALLQANARLAEDALGAIGLEAGAKEAICKVWMALSPNSAEQLLEKLLNVRELARDFARSSFRELNRQHRGLAIRL
jgi:hypothetical protein